MDPQYLYRLFDADGILLYAGITDDWTRRMREHWLSKPWAREILSIIMETYPDRHSVMDAERHAIHSEGPLYNIQHNHGPDDEPVPASSLTADDMLAFALLLALTGYVLYKVGEAAVARYRKWKADREEFLEWKRTRDEQAGAKIAPQPAAVHGQQGSEPATRPATLIPPAPRPGEAAQLAGSPAAFVKSPDPRQAAVLITVLTVVLAAGKSGISAELRGNPGPASA